MVMTEADIEQIIVKVCKRSLYTDSTTKYYINLPIYFETYRKVFRIGPFGNQREAQSCRNRIVLSIRKKQRTLLNKVDQRQTFAPTLYDV